MQRFVFTKLPMPPSINHQYWNRVLPGGNVAQLTPTKELKEFVSAMDLYRQKNLVWVYKARSNIRQWLLRGHMLSVTVMANFHGMDLWTQKGTPKKMDASNRIKAMHDCLAEVLQVDDSWFWRVTIEKVETVKSEPWCIAWIEPYKPRSVTEVKQQEML